MTAMYFYTVEEKQCRRRILRCNKMQRHIKKMLYDSKNMNYNDAHIKLGIVFTLLAFHMFVCMCMCVCVSVCACACVMRLVQTERQADANSSPLSKLNSTQIPVTHYKLHIHNPNGTPHRNTMNQTSTILTVRHHRNTKTTHLQS